MGLTPDEKRRYKKSKRRRRQANVSFETGVIPPFRKRRNGLLIAVIAAVLAVLAAGGTWFAVTHFGQQEKTEQVQQQQDNLLLVVNRLHPLDRDYVPELTDFEGYKVNVNAYDDLKAMTDEAAKQGITLRLTSAYLTFDEQQSLFEAELATVLADPSYSEVRARAAAQRRVPPGGCSEAQTGLLIGFDISDLAAKAFLERSCVSHGFVQRFPDDKADYLQMEPNDSLYRYVGHENAVKMRAYNLCLEEYLTYLETSNEG